MIAIVAVIVALVILVFFAIGYLFGRLFLLAATVCRPTL